jgi:uncharacterized membrane protein
MPRIIPPALIAVYLAPSRLTYPVSPMNLPDASLSAPVAWIAAAGFSGALGVSALCAPWSRFEGSFAQVYATACAAVLLLWFMGAGVEPGLSVHLLGTVLLVLMFDLPLGLLGSALVLVAATAAGRAGWLALGANGLALCVVPALAGRALLRLAWRRLPDNFFVYVFVNGYLAGAVSIVCAGLASAGLLWTSGSYDAEHLAYQYLVLFPMLAFAEGFLTGGAAAIFAAYRPGWLMTFDDARYLRNRPAARRPHDEPPMPE